MKNGVLCIIQARALSTRLPGKVLKKINGVSMLEWQLRRVQLAKTIDTITVATGEGEENDPLQKLCRNLQIPCFRGDENDVLDRFYQCTQNYPNHSIIVRLTGDCPLIDPKIINEAVTFFKKNAYDYVSNVGGRQETFPDGMDVEVLAKKALETAAKKTLRPSDREHVTPYIKRNTAFKKYFLNAPYNFSHIRLTVDEPEDFIVVSYLIKKMSIVDDYLSLIALLTKRPDIMLQNVHIGRNEGYAKSLAQENKTSPK
jgi:spore coat polysaccharide biosynthesis protein SpsF (cytidylyltransferase family)